MYYVDPTLLDAFYIFFERELARLAAVHVAGLEEKGGAGDCFQKVWQDFTRVST